MEQHAFEFDTSIAAEGHRQALAANEHQFTQAQYDAWLEQFLAKAGQVFGLAAATENSPAKLAREFERRGYFGFAHYLQRHGQPRRPEENTSHCQVSG
ncbi:MAG: hypothetical protein ACREUV_04950 [Burkholderiales bacterium]